MANANGWGDGASNNNIGWGQGSNNAIGWGSVYSVSSAGATDIIGVVAPSLLLDTYSGAAVAYSLRKLRSAYTGNAIRVRRNIDNAEQDIAFVGNDLDTTSMLDFVGYNMWTYSEDISNAQYSRALLNTTGTPAYIDVETAPDSTLSGDKIIENTANGSHQVARGSGTRINGTDYNISVYLKQGERTKVLVLSQISGTLQSCEVDLTNGTTSNNTFSTTPTVTSVSNGWYRFSVTATANGTASVSAGIVVRLSNGTATSYTGDGTSGAYVWGFQLSQTSTVKTYQKTVATAGGNGFVTTWYDQSGNGLNSTMSTAVYQPRIVNAGVLDVKNLKAGLRFDGSNDYLTRSALTALNSGNTYSIFSVSANETTAIAGDILVTNNGFPTSRLSLFNSTITTGGVYRIGSIQNTSIVTYASNMITADGTANQRQLSFIVNGFNIAGWKNGVAGTTDTYTGSYTNNVFTLGAFLNVPRHLNGYIQELIIYPTDQSSNRTGIESNINTFYTIY